MQNYNSKIYKLKLAKSRKRGFTLVETLVALTVLTVGISASLTLISHSLKTASYYQNQTTAFYLAVEGIEFIRNWRDNNFIQGMSWLQDLNNCISSNGCYATPAPDIGQPYISACAPNCPNLKYSVSRNLYNYSPSSIDTAFSRKITISNASSFGNDEREVISKITWQDRFGSQSIELKTHIFNWQ